jgi:hypothetical protein
MTTNEALTEKYFLAIAPIWSDFHKGKLSMSQREAALAVHRAQLDRDLNLLIATSNLNVKPKTTIPTPEELTKMVFEYRMRKVAKQAARKAYYNNKEQSE